MVVAQDCPGQVGIAWPPLSYDNRQQTFKEDININQLPHVSAHFDEYRWIDYCGVVARN